MCKTVWSINNIINTSKCEKSDHDTFSSSNSKLLVDSGCQLRRLQRSHLSRLKKIPDEKMMSLLMAVNHCFSISRSSSSSYALATVTEGLVYLCCRLGVPGREYSSFLSEINAYTKRPHEPKRINAPVAIKIGPETGDAKRTNNQHSIVSDLSTHP